MDTVSAHPAVSKQPETMMANRAGWFRNRAVWFGGLGVLCFSLTLPATHLAEAGFGSVTVGLGRALVAAVLAGIVLLIRRERIPPRRTWGSLVCVAGGVVVGFPLFSTLALEGTPVAHGAIIGGLLPTLTAVGGVLRGGERPHRLFWFSCVAGMMAVLLFAAIQGGGHLQIGDIWMLAAVGTGAVGTGAVGYIEGGRLARGGIARISQLQLLQPLLTIAWAALLLGERLTLLTGASAFLAVLCVVIGQWSRLHHA